MEAGDRAPDAPDMLHLVALGESDLHPKMLFCLYRPWYHTVLALLQVMQMLAQSWASWRLTTLHLHQRRSANLSLIDQQGHTYLAYLVESGHTKGEWNVLMSLR